MSIWLEDQVVRTAIFHLVDRYYVTDKLVKAFTGPNQDEEDVWGVWSPPPPTSPPKTGLVQGLTHPSAKQNTPRRMQLQTQSKGMHNLQAYLHSRERTSHPARNRTDQDRTIQMLPNEHRPRFSGSHKSSNNKMAEQKRKIRLNKVEEIGTCKWFGNIHQLEDWFLKM